MGLVLIEIPIPLGFPQTGWNWVGWIGVVPIFTAIAGNCPLYTVIVCIDLPGAEEGLASILRHGAEIRTVNVVQVVEPTLD